MGLSVSPWKIQSHSSGSLQISHARQGEGWGGGGKGEQKAESYVVLDVGDRWLSNLLSISSLKLILTYLFKVK
jgi:hypothetical protein